MEAFTEEIGHEIADDLVVLDRRHDLPVGIARSGGLVKKRVHPDQAEQHSEVSAQPHSNMWN